MTLGPYKLHNQDNKHMIISFDIVFNEFQNQQRNFLLV